MCLIIQRDPNFEIPYEKFESAIKVNPDGYGLAFADGGRLVTLRDPSTPDPEVLYRHINEDLIDKKLMLHLRFTTAGETNLRNAHPFPILEKKVDGIDLRMAHNGTLFSYKSKAAKWESDTRAFVRLYVRPLFKRMAKAVSPEELLKDGFIKELLEDKLTTNSVLTFIDGEGSTLICNETGNGGKKESGWYFSNSYSFNSSHRTKVVTPPVTYSSSSRVVYSGPRQQVSVGQGQIKTTSKICAGFNTPRFSEKHGLDDPLKLTQLSDETIDRIVSDGDAPILIKELLFEMDKLKKDNRMLNIKLKRSAN
jgi:hypothetical protein